MIDLLLLTRLRAGEDIALLLMRWMTGAFLIHGVWDNISSAARMQEFAEFLQDNGFLLPELMAPLSVWVQFAVGVCFVAGLLTRWAGIFCVVNFVVACLMVHLQQDIRGWWPALALVLIGALLATRGAGRFALDHLLRAERSAGPGRR